MTTKLLERLYKTHSPSHQEDRMNALLQKELTKMTIPYSVDEYGQVYRITPGQPLVVAHMDQVQRAKCHKVMMVKNRLYGFSKKGKLTGLGADDKNGIFIIIELLKTNPSLSFIFSASEEAGGKLHTLTSLVDLTSTPYGLVFDRRGHSDIIGTSNNYCCDDLETAIHVIGEEFGYKPAQGTFSDCDELSVWIPCVNLSCGYYEAHTEKEYTKLPELWNAIRLAQALLKELSGPFELADPLPSYRGSWHWNNDLDYTHPKTQTKKENTRMIEEMSLLAVDVDEVTFFTTDGNGIFLGETVNESLGTWDMDTDAKLKVFMDSKGTLKATYQGVAVDVQEFDNGAPGEILSGPSSWVTT